jgi:hypothetical protein
MTITIIGLLACALIVAFCAAGKACDRTIYTGPANGIPSSKSFAILDLEKLKAKDSIDRTMECRASPASLAKIAAAGSLVSFDVTVCKKPFCQPRITRLTVAGA